MKASLILGVAVMLASGAAFAHKGNHEGACKKDVEKFCKDVQPGGGAILKCLNEHKAELSSECKERHAEMKGKMKEFTEACKEDLNTYCSSTAQGKGRKLKCLGKNEDKLTPACKSEVVAMKAKHHEHQKAKAEKIEEEENK